MILRLNRLTLVSVAAQRLHAQRETHPVGLGKNDDLIPDKPQMAIKRFKQHPRHMLRFFRRDGCRTDTGALKGQC